MVVAVQRGIDVLSAEVRNITGVVRSVRRLVSRRVVLALEWVATEVRLRASHKIVIVAI